MVSFVNEVRSKVVRSRKQIAKKYKSKVEKSKKQLARQILPALPAWGRDAALSLMSKHTRLHTTIVSAIFHHDPVAAMHAYRLFNAGTPDIDSNYDRELIRRAVEFDYVGWVRRIQPYVRGKSILDVGCGNGLHGVGYIIAGAKSYTGLDPKINIDSDLGKNKRTGNYEHFGVTPREIMKRMPRIRLVSGVFEDIAPEETFDLVILHNVTEHLLNIETVFEGINNRLHSEGTVIYHHHNFYCWNGHHLPPRTIDQIDENDPGQRELMDWNHLSFDPPEGHYIRRGLNKIRLDELKTLTERLFDIDAWEEILLKENEGLKRLTPEILARHPQYTQRELTVKNVLCVVHKKGMQTKNEKSGKKTSSRERDMRRDEIFMSLYERCKPYTMTSMERLYGLYQAIGYLQRHQIEGDFVECGVWRGGSMMMVALSLLHMGGKARDLYLFDTFEGMPTPTIEDFKFGERDNVRDKWEQLKKEQGSHWNYAPVDEVRESMLSTGYPAKRIHIVQGMVENTLPAQAPEKIALLRLDTDFYASTVHEFEHLYPRLAQHGVLIIDDFGTWAGSAQATKEYFERNGVLMLLNRLDPGGRLGVKTEPAKWQG